MGLFTSYGVGVYAPGQAAEAHTVIHDRLYKPDASRRGILHLHSAGGNNQEPVLPVNNVLPLIQEAASRVGPLISFDGAPGFPAQHWANDFAQARCADARNFIQAAPWSAKPGKVLILAVSMGAMLALNWARANPGLVAAIALLYPAVNLQWIHDNGGAASTEAAYGGLAAFNAAVAAHNPKAHATEYASLGVPLKMWYSTADAVVSTAEQEAFAKASGVPAVPLGPVGHADMTVLPVSDIVNYLLENA